MSMACARMLVRGAAVALVAAMLAGTASAQSGGNYNVTRGVNRPGNDYVRTAPVSPEECQGRCDRDPKCKVWVYAAPPDPRAGCYLKALIPAETVDRCCVVGVKRDPSASAPPAGSPPPPGSPPPAPPTARPAPPPGPPTGGPRIQEFHDVCSDCGHKRVDLGAHDFCALTGFVIGGFNSRCNVGRSGPRWYLDLTDPGPPDPWQGESQECGATCFTFAR